MSASPSVTFADDEPNGLADLIGRLIESNLAADPGRRRFLHGGTVEIRAADAGVGAVLELAPSGVVVRNATAARVPSDVTIAASSADLLALTAAPLAMGVPDPRTPSGRAILRKVLTRKIRIGGLLSRPASIARVARLLSVAVDGDR